MNLHVCDYKLKWLHTVSDYNPARHVEVLTDESWPQRNYKGRETMLLGRVLGLER
jgi:hypothetical protein